MTDRIACIGECMLELSGASHDRMTLSYRVDTLNTAIYLARLGRSTISPRLERPVQRMDDRRIASQRCRHEFGLARAHSITGILSYSDRCTRRTAILPLARSSTGPRPLRLAGCIRILKNLPQYKLIYLSGISLSLYEAAGREKLHTALTSAKADGTKFAFDSNYRPR